MATQQNWTDEALENLAKKIKADMADLHKDRAAFNRIVRGVPEAGESRASKLEIMIEII
jgi:peptide subunit release factor RF-3